MRASYDETRRHILEAGQRIISVKGFSAVGLSEILAEARIPKGSFYHYFESKEGYGAALLTQYLDDYIAALDATLQADGSPAQARLMRYWQGWLDAQVSCETSGRCLIVKLSAEVADLSDDMRLALRDGTDRLICRIAQCVQEGLDDGSIARRIDAQPCAQTLYQLWLGASLLTKLRRDGSALQQAMAFTRQMLG